MTARVLAEKLTRYPEMQVRVYTSTEMDGATFEDIQGVHTLTNLAGIIVIVSNPDSGETIDLDEIVDDKDQIIGTVV